jgi:PAS domain S-box-containing protein
MNLPYWLSKNENYEFEALCEEGEWALFRGCPTSPAIQQTILVAGPSSERSTAELEARFSNELRLKPYLDSSWAALPMSMGRNDPVTRLILQDPGGVSLASLTGAKLPIESILKLAISASRSVRRMHDAGLVHKDIKPANLLVEASGDRVWLTGFGIASRLPRERQSLIPPEIIAGTFAYMAPEQTGRINRSIDPRTDLYSLGVTLYQVLTGALPFAGRDAMEWIHCHIARTPIPASERSPGIPEAVSAIVMKLLAKAAEDRYQTAAGLKADLEHCLADWQATGNVEQFELGVSDVPDKLMFREKLYGRENELHRLNDAFENVANSVAAELVLVSGYSGIGKSSFVNELQSALVSRRAFFAAGKFDQYRRGVPYATLAEAFQSVVDQLLSRSQRELTEWRDKLLFALGINGQLMVNLIPDLQHIIGVQPPLPDLSGGEAKTRFRAVFRHFVGVFAQPDHPLVLFLDDLQWLDSATLDVFEDLATNMQLQSLLLVGAYRDNEVGEGHPLAGRLNALRAKDIAISEIELKAIIRSDVTLMIADAIKEEPYRVGSLSETVFEKAGGNPFFTTQFVATLVDRELLSYNSILPGWEWDVSRIRAMHVSDNIVDLMMERLALLSPDSLQIVKQLACLGNTVALGLLRKLIDLASEVTQTSIQEVLQSGLLILIDDAYAFAHDRVHEAAYNMLSLEERKAFHWRLGRRMLDALDNAEMEFHIFDIVSQFNRTSVPRDEQFDITIPATLNLRAARKAKASAAFSAACGFLEHAHAQLGETGWDTHYELAFAIALEHAESTFLSGDFDGTTHMIDELLQRGMRAIDLAATYRLKVELHVVKSEIGAAIDSGIAALAFLGIDFTAHPTQHEVDVAYGEIWKNLNGKSLAIFAELPPMEDATMLAAMRILADMWDPGYSFDFNLTIVITCKMVNLSLLHGRANASNQGFAWFGWLLGPAFGRYEDGLATAQLANTLALSGKDGLDASRTYHALALTLSWTKSLSKTVEAFQLGYQLGREAGDIYFACYAAAQAVLYSFVGGEELSKVAEDCQEALTFVQSTGFHDGIIHVRGFERAVASLRGFTRGIGNYGDGQFDEAAFEADLMSEHSATVIYWYWTRKVMLNFLAGDFEGALAAAERVHTTRWIKIVHVQHVDFHFYSALALAALVNDSPEADVRAIRTRIDQHASQLKEWATDTSSGVFTSKYALVLAEIARLEGRYLEAQRLFDESIVLAQRNGFVQDEAVANEVAARFYALNGLQKIGRSFLLEARSCYFRWGAHAKVRQLETLHHHLKADDGHVTKSTGTTIAPVEQLDLVTVMKLAQTVSGEIVLEKLIDALMRTTLEHAGAERAVLLLARSGEHWVEAEAATSGEGVSVRLREELNSVTLLPEPMVQFVLRTSENLIVDDASISGPFAGDDYAREHRIRSLLALPLVNQGKLIGLLYLENKLAAGVFTPNRISILKLIASHAAVALENTRLYRDLETREAKIRRLVDADIIGVFMWNSDGDIFDANDAFLEIIGFDRSDLALGRLRWTDLSPPTEWETDARKTNEVSATGRARPWEKVFLRKDGSRVPVLIGAAAFGESEVESGVAYVLDLTLRKRAEEAARESDRQYRELQAELAHANRIATMGQLSAAISHDLKQPLAGIVASGAAGLKWLARDPPDQHGVRRAFERVVSEGRRAGELLNRTRALVKKTPPQSEVLDINGIISETLDLVNAAALRKQVLVKTELTDGPVPVFADRIQLQQVILNLSINAIEAMASVMNTTSTLTIISTQEFEDYVCVAVKDTGPGIPPGAEDLVFEAFYSTKPDGMGMGLAICKAIVSSYGGHLWATQSQPNGATFWMRLPIAGQLKGSEFGPGA